MDEFIMNELISIPQIKKQKKSGVDKMSYQFLKSNKPILLIPNNTPPTPRCTPYSSFCG
jgi:hypothetical protein